MALFDRNDGRYDNRDMNRGRNGGFLDRVQNAFRGQDVNGDEHLRYENRSGMDAGTGYGGANRGWNAGGYNNQPMDREGGLHQRNSWSDGAWTADAGERADREWNAGNRSLRNDYDRDMSPFQAGWRAGGMSGGMSGGMGMNRGMQGGMSRGLNDDRGWNLGGGDREWGHTGNLGGGNPDHGYSAGGMGGDWGHRGGMNRGGGFLDRAQNAVRRGWDNLEDRFDRDDRDDMHMGGSSMRGGTSWAGRYDRDWHAASDVRGYRDDEGHYGTTHAGGMMGGAGMSGGMNRYGNDYDRGMLGRGGYDRGSMDRGGMDYDRGFKSRQQTDAGDPFGDRQSQTPIRVTGNGMNNGLSGRGSVGRYDNGYDRGGRDWF